MDVGMGGMFLWDGGDEGVWGGVWRMRDMVGVCVYGNHLQSHCLSFLGQVVALEICQDVLYSRR